MLISWWQSQVLVLPKSLDQHSGSSLFPNQHIGLSPCPFYLISLEPLRFIAINPAFWQCMMSIKPCFTQVHNWTAIPVIFFHVFKKIVPLNDNSCLLHYKLLSIVFLKTKSHLLRSNFKIVLPLEKCLFDEQLQEASV